MGLFNNFYTKEGPGVPKDLPQKKGFARFFEIVFRDMGMIWTLGLLTMLCFAPAIIAAVATILVAPYLLLIIAGIVLYLLASMLVGPALCGMHAVIISRIRDIPCYMMTEYKKAWKSNLKQSIPAGVIMMAIFGIELYTGYTILMSPDDSALIMLGVVLLTLILLMSTSQMVFLQMLFLNLKLPAMAKNGLLMTIGYLKRMFPMAIIGVVVLGAMLLFYVFWPFYIMLGVVGFLTVITDMWAWPVMEKAFKITEQQEEIRKQRELEEQQEQIEK